MTLSSSPAPPQSTPPSPSSHSAAPSITPGGAAEPGGGGGGGAPSPKGKPKSVLGASGGEWRQSLPEDIRNDKSLELIADVPALARSFINAQKMVGSRVAIPGQDAKADEWEAFYAKLGRPEKPDGYKVPEGFTDDDKAVLEGVLGAAHEAGLSDRQLEPLLNWYQQFAKDSREARETARSQQREEAETSLRKEWGAHYDTKIEAAKQALKTFGGEQLAAWLEDNGMGNEPMLIRLLADVGKIVSEHKVGTRGAPHMPESVTSESAKREIAKLHMKPEFELAYRDPHHPGHEEAKRQIMELAKVAYPGDTVIDT